jgi:hypothetical protein
MTIATTWGALVRRGLVAGAIAGVAAAIGGVIALLVMQGITGDRYPELTPVSVAALALIGNVVGGVLYAALARRTARPTFWYATLALVAATLDSLISILNPLHPGFAVVATPLHYVVAGISIALVPWLFARNATR